MAPRFPCPSNLPSKESYLKVIDEMNTSWASAILGFLLAFGTIITTFPLVIKIAKKKSPIGISGMMLVLANVNQFLTFLNTWILSFERFVACEYTSACISAFFPPIQYLGLWLCYFVTWVLYTKYYGNVLGKDNVYKAMVLGASLFIGIATFLTIFLSIYTAYQGACDGTPYYIFVQLISIVGAIVSLFEWIPQIISTISLRDSGSFSLLMLSLQMPGAIIIVLYDAVLAKLDWTSWFGWVITIILEAILITCLITFRVHRKRYPDYYISHDRRKTILRLRAHAVNSKEDYELESLICKEFDMEHHKNTSNHQNDKKHETSDAPFDAA